MFFEIRIFLVVSLWMTEIYDLRYQLWLQERNWCQCLWKLAYKSSFNDAIKKFSRPFLAANFETNFFARGYGKLFYSKQNVQIVKSVFVSSFHSEKCKVLYCNTRAICVRQNTPTNWISIFCIVDEISLLLHILTRWL